MKYVISLIIGAIALSSCEKFLDASPQEGGLQEFKTVQQYDALLNNFRITRNRIEWANAIMASDDCHYEPEWQLFASASVLSSTQTWSAFSTWNQDQYRSQGGSASGFLPFQATYANMYDFNYIIETIEGPGIAGSSVLRKQVKAEAQFWRAFHHLLLAVEFCAHPGLNGGNNPGLGYRNSISPTNNGVQERNTIKYTFDNILADLLEAEQGLTDAGKTSLNTSEPWRISTPAVQGVLARTHLYLGNYKEAFEYARKAYTAYSFLYDLKDLNKFAMRDLTPVQTETFNGVAYSVMPRYPAIIDDNSTVNPASHSNYYYKEAYFRYVSQLGAILKMPPTQALYNMYDTVDLRRKVYFDNNNNINSTTWLPARYKDQLISKSYQKNAASRTQAGYILSVTVPEMMLIMAECRARGAGDGQNASVILKDLRSKRYPAGYVDNIGGTLKDVKDERRRELAMVFRWFDLKRYNALDNAGISITKRGFADPFNPNSNIINYTLAPNAPTYALPIIQSEIELLGWPQNEYGGVTKQ